MAMRPDSPYSPLADVAPTTEAPNDYIRTEATPQDFGAQIGQSTQQLGKTGEQIGQDLGDYALQAQAIFNKTSIDASYNQHQDTANKLLYGDPNDPNDHGFMSLTGADAMNARAGVMAKLQESQNELSGKLPTVARAQFEDQSRRLNQMVYSDIGQHANQQFLNWSVQTQDATKATSLQALGADPANDNTFTLGVTQVQDAAAQKAHLLGASPETGAAMQIQAKNDAYATRAKVWGLKDPVSAFNFLTTNQGQFEPGTYATLYDELLPKANTIKAGNIVNGIVPLPGPAGLGPAAGAVQSAAQTQGVDPTQALTVAQLESQGGAEHDRPGSKYSGVFQMGSDEFAQNNPGGTRGNVADEAQAGVNNLKRIQPIADAAVGGTAAPWQVYLVHQQGDAGGTALLKADPNMTAVDALTPAYKGDKQAATAAVFQNGGLPTTTVGQFTSMWQQKYDAAEQQVRGHALTSGPAPYPDMGALEQKVIDATPNDPVLQHDALATLHQRVDLLLTQAKQAKDGLDHTIANTQAALLTGDTSAAIPESQIRAAFPADEAQQRIDQLSTARQAGVVIKSTQFATPEKLTSAIADLDSPNSPISLQLRSQKVAPGGVTGAPDGNALSPETVDQTVFRKNVQQMLVQQLQARQTALKNDPAAYAVNEPVVKAAQATIDPKVPATFENYARLTVSTQKMLGVADTDTRVLTAEQSQGIAKQLTGGDPAKVDVGNEIDSLSQKYGQAWPQVWHDVVRDGHMPPEFQVLGSMPAGPDRMQMQRALQYAATKGGVENMRKDIDPAAAQDIDKNVDAAMEPLRQTLMVPGLGGGAEQFSTFRNAIRTSALYGTLMSGQGGIAALNKATAGALPYDFEGMARAPKGMGGQAESYGASVISNLKGADIGPTSANPDLLPSQVQQAGLAAVKRSGVWVTNSRDDGWELVVPNKMGGYQLVTRPNGQRIGFKFADMPKGVQVASGSEAAGSGATAGVTP
jgi:hypothetical protein